MEAAAAVLAGILPVLKAQGVYLAAQCCEHLNRAIVIEQEAAEKYGYEQVNAVPQPHAGAAGQPTAGRRLNIRFWWRKCVPLPELISAVR